MDIIRASGVMASLFKENSGLLGKRFKLKLFKTLYMNKMTCSDDWNSKAGAGNGPKEIFKGLILWH